MDFDVLIVDDETCLADMTAEYFNAFGVKTFTVAAADACLEFLKENKAALILLDINLVESSGFDLCRVIRREYSTPIFFVSARVSTDDILIALNIGGDDYITKPYELNVLLAKIKARLKREQDKIKPPTLIVIDNLKIDFSKMEAYLGDKSLGLKAKEFKLLAYLIANKNKIVTKDEILNNVWGDTYISDGALNIQIFRLREKIEKKPDEPQYIKTVWGKGYMFETRE